MSSVPQAQSQERVAHYEQLRSDALSLSAGHKPMPGLALLLRQGMTVWMRAWSPCTPKPGAEVLPAAPSKPYPLEVRAQIATLIAGIILGQQLEVAP
jgi:hypothetical protein